MHLSVNGRVSPTTESGLSIKVCFQIKMVSNKFITNAKCAKSTNLIKVWEYWAEGLLAQLGKRKI